MANYYATARSNYFAVTDEEAFKAWAEKRGLTVMEPTHEFVQSDNVKRFAVHPNEQSDNGAWPQHEYDEENDEWVEIDFYSELAAYLISDEVAVLMEVGNEKIRYVAGNAVAINSKNEMVSIDLEQIYTAAAARQLGTKITRAEY